MRTFKLQAQVTIDGFMGGPDGEMDWLTFDWSPDLKAHVGAMTEAADLMVLGRNLADGFIPAWEARPAGESDKAIDWMIDTPKVIVSTTLTEPPRPNTTIATDVVATVKELKARDGGDIITYGGATLVHALIANDLLDELHLFVNPVAIGKGLPVFPGAEAAQRFELLSAKAFECGVAELVYAPKR
ncbi:dihydrofolate reductase family protein [Fodinicola acaciae]|uniref:dihydrofolate reductase family protein n=1 Tax=Fodinicola acaciae TaxID=2681555 RepID=UPI0013D77302|nr:dihydrofolate reductase family protein [Fodinicola acaciae]